MAWNQLSSSQIKNSAVLGQHIKSKAIDGTHIADNAITDVHLNIDWAAKGTAILASKKVIDYVQAPARTAAVDEATVNIASGITLAEAATDNDLGVVVSAGKNKVILLEKEDPSKLLTDPVTGNVVYGRITTGFNLGYYILVNGVETAYRFTEETEYNLQFPARFTLDTVSEMFAANEKFVDGVADVATRLDVAQLVADIFGAGYTLNQDGQPVLAGGQTVMDIIDAVSSVADENTVDIEALSVILSGTEGNEASGIVSKVAVLQGKVAALEAQNLDGRITDIENEELPDRVTDLEDINATVRLADLESDVSDLKSAHVALPHRADKLVDAEVSGYMLTTDFSILAINLPKPNTVDVYVNGMLQMIGQHYVENVVEDTVRGLDFTPNTVKPGDTVQLRWEV